jgi:hypothetical protein
MMAMSRIAPDDQARAHRLDCLEHLRRADDAVRACKVLLAPLGSARDRTVLEGLCGSLAGRLDELHVLTGRPLLFHGEATYDAVLRLTGQLTMLAAKLEPDPAGARRLWRDEMARGVRRVLQLIVQEVERLLKKL